MQESSRDPSGCDLPLLGTAVLAAMVSGGGSVAGQTERLPKQQCPWPGSCLKPPAAAQPAVLGSESGGGQDWPGTVLNSADNNILHLMALPCSKAELRAFASPPLCYLCHQQRVLHSPGHQVILRSLSNMFGCSNQTPVRLFSPFHFTRFTVFPLETPFFADDAMFSHTVDLLSCGKPQSHLTRKERTWPFMSEKKPNPVLGCTLLLVL